MRRVALAAQPGDQAGLLKWCASMIAELCRASNVDTREQIESDILAFQTPMALDDGATVSFDWSAAQNFTLQVSGNRMLGNPSNAIPGQWRTINVSGNNATLRTLTFDTQFSSGKPTLTDITATKNYLLEIYCVSATLFIVRATNSSA